MRWVVEATRGTARRVVAAVHTRTVTPVIEVLQRDGIIGARLERQYQVIGSLVCHHIRLARDQFGSVSADGQLPYATINTWSAAELYLHVGQLDAVGSSCEQ